MVVLSLVDALMAVAAGMWTKFYHRAKYLSRTNYLKDIESSMRNVYRIWKQRDTGYTFRSKHGQEQTESSGWVDRSFFVSTVLEITASTFPTCDGWNVKHKMGNWINMQQGFSNVQQNDFNSRTSQCSCYCSCGCCCCRWWYFLLL